MEFHLKLIGLLFMALAFIHIGFPKYFKWAEELKSLSLINRQMMMTHTYFIALTVLFMGVLCYTSYDDLLHTALGRKLSFGLGCFWAVRLYFQLFIYSTDLWLGKLFETTMHILFTAFWVYLCITFLTISMG
jgi:hypothetical protein